MPAKLVFSVLLLLVSIVSAFSGTFTFGTYPNVSYGSNRVQLMDIYVPIGTTDSINPTILLIHGGAWKGGDKAELTSIAQFFASQGYTAANINYRLATPTSNQYPAAVNDSVLAVLFLQMNAAPYHVDKTRISALGTSAGANLALALGTRNLVNGVMEFYGPTDFTSRTFLTDSLGGESNAQIMANYLGFTLAKNPALYGSASPINNLSIKMPPTIIFHGSRDTTVPPDQSTKLSVKLQMLGVVSSLNIEPGLPHGFLTQTDPTPYLNQCISFLQSQTSVKASAQSK